MDSVSPSVGAAVSIVKALLTGAAMLDQVKCSATSSVRTVFHATVSLPLCTDTFDLRLFFCCQVHGGQNIIHTTRNAATASASPHGQVGVFVCVRSFGNRFGVVSRGPLTCPQASHRYTLGASPVTCTQECNCPPMYHLW